MLRPSIRMSPSSNGISLLTSFSAVVLPPPDGPTSTQKQPAGIVEREIVQRRGVATRVVLRHVVEDDLGGAVELMLLARRRCPGGSGSRGGR